MNGCLSSRDIEHFIPLSSAVQQFLTKASTSFCLSSRVLHRLIKVARTIADSEECHVIEVKHVAEALQYRSKTMFLE